ncbi:hypothetical protein [Coralloluteibacterium thermophilus]|uniref:Uncharacterized protein n=1 Tax=Coralloluteibacterium thermophilum TaxID=2707049 RepID=A0ABV9NJM5_9GAMM
MNRFILTSALFLSAPTAALALDAPATTGEPCPPHTSSESRQAPDGSDEGAASRAPSSSGTPARADGGGAETGLPRSSQPRWHSFLPGMIR